MPGVTCTPVTFSNLSDVLSAALNRGNPAPACDAIDNRLIDSDLSADQQFQIAHATRSYYGSTQLLDVGGKPYWVVNEGEYCMMNTLDLSVDQMFWELDQNPWVVRNLLDNFVRHYSYVDQLKGPAGKTLPGGISFTHDQGAHNNFSPHGHSSYELPELNALCFSYMTAEQLCNWVLMATTYVVQTGDTNWARQNGHVLLACMESLRNRGGDSGIPEFDSCRCGAIGCRNHHIRFARSLARADAEQLVHGREILGELPRAGGTVRAARQRHMARRTRPGIGLGRAGRAHAAAAGRP